MSERFDAIVVGAGPAGSAAALVMARGGLKMAEMKTGYRLEELAGALRGEVTVAVLGILDERGRTARLMVDLTASLMGRRILDRPTRSH